MKTTTAQALTVAAVLTAMSGCQSGPRWAWWKPEAAPTDASAVARSADAPQLPSAQAAPPVAVPGLQPAASPSAANLAAAGAPSAPGIAIPASPPSTIANAPLANYPSMDAAAPIMAAGTMPQMASASVPPSGPYDPNSYRPSANISAGSTASPDGKAATPDRYQFSGDRYGVTPVGSAPMETEQPPRSAENVPAAPPASNTITGDRYGVTTPDRTVAPQPSVAALTPPTPITSPTTATVASLTAPAAMPAATATVQAATPAGQYRPGGTSSYIGAMSAQHVEVATRPAPTATSPVTQPVSPAVGSVPWAPTTTSPTPAAGTQRY